MSAPVYKSLYFDQEELIDAIETLYCVDGIECDLTYGNGAFYKNRKRPDTCLDIDPQQDHVNQCCSTETGLNDCSLSNLMFDPPFLTYIRAARNGNGNMVMANRFSGYWRYDELEDHYKKTLKEASRILKKKGKMIFKCQDIIHNHKMHCTHANIINWAFEYGFRLQDLFVLAARHRMPSPNRNGTQKHARVFHSYFLVLEKTK